MGRWLRWIWVLAGVLTVGVAAGDIYRKIDGDQVIFADHPFAGAEKMDERPINTVPALGGVDTEVSKAAVTAPALTIEISSPVDGQTYPYDTSVAVDFKVLPHIPVNDHMRVELDGAVVQGHRLQHLDRGEHHLQVMVLDAKDRVQVAKSVGFTVYQHSLLGPHP